jgi:hypothetical protein
MERSGIEAKCRSNGVGDFESHPGRTPDAFTLSKGNRLK